MKDIDKKYPGQVCQDERTNYKFRNFHKHLVNQVINFCKSHNLEIDEFELRADGLSESIKYGSWQPCTDSYLGLYKEDMRFDNEPYLMSL